VAGEEVDLLEHRLLRHAGPLQAQREVVHPQALLVSDELLAALLGAAHDEAVADELLVGPRRSSFGIGRSSPQSAYALYFCSR